MKELLTKRGVQAEHREKNIRKGKCAITTHKYYFNILLFLVNTMQWDLWFCGHSQDIL